ncbi:MAG: hypothetical protein A3K19_19115 [Lentisphaerae bacterium RIFOXYB12_FULL_65_16]|nr:MAG: hypothetical protein A3K18_23945 [Lentisphaerae bacterium RIFOXYA12_64_32]OGV91562.1 MAG: hypothetical protein A3K19_19115 [Lentisphaerae bacterium RIFOXYB12_FULL_65_16]
MNTRHTLLATAACAACLTATPLQAADPAQVNLAGDWSVTVTTGQTSSKLDVPPPDIVEVNAEKYDKMPEFNPKAWGGWQKGLALRGVKAAECTVKGALDPASLVVRDGADATATTFEKGKDYDADLDWGGVGRLASGAVKPSQPVFISYKYAQMRIDAVVLTTDGKIVLKRGEPHTATPQPVELAQGETRLANIFISGRLERLTPENLYPILETAYPEPPKPTPSIAETLLPKTMKKLQGNEPVKILAWGDSVTAMNRWQKLFLPRLQERFPHAKIELVTEAWGGHNTSSYLAEPPGSVHNYKEKVLDQKPDLIISEFVNDAGMNPQQTEERYGKLLADIQGIGAEWIILTPHYIRPDWMKLTAQREIDNDPRPYVTALRQFTQKNNIALADASLRYGRLWRQGIPYLTLMDNNINHPNMQGHALFADSLMALFP